VGSTHNLQNKNSEKSVSSQKSGTGGKVRPRIKKQARKSHPAATSKIADSPV